LPSPRYLVIHGHFYQPPRENPWSGSVSPQPTAAPFHDWNERINRECYAPNARARVLGPDGKITKIVNNYEYISSNFGPTLLAWLKEADPKTLSLIAQADREASQKRGGHGPAMAQVFNHVIMPLANRRDKATQAKWGKKWFEQIFGRAPEGMWLAETAADLDSLKVLSQEGIKFTILAQNQIEAVRPLGSGEPFVPQNGRADPREPYRVFWGEGDGDFIDVFVYDGPVSRAVAFENLLRDGQTFKNRIEAAFGAELPGQRPRLVNLATDGESYGHHFRFGEMALSWLIDKLETEEEERVEGQNGQSPVILTTYGEFLALHPPRLEARIIERTSWSCVHGIERWRSDCGCRVGSEPGWNQKWRTPLREGLDCLRDELAIIFERESEGLLKDPWAARDDYVEILLSEYSEESKEKLLDKHKAKELSAIEAERALELLEMQLMSMYMFTSCAWFFDDLAGLEPVQNLRYALRAIELAGLSERNRLEEALLERLRSAVPNDPDYPDGEAVWRRLVSPAALSPNLAAAHWAASRALEAPDALKELDKLSFNEKRANLSEDPDGSRTLEALIEFRDPKLDFQGRLKACRAATGPGGRGLRILVSDPPPSEGGPESPSPGDTFTLADLWPGVRESLLSHLVRDFFGELRSQTLKSFEISSNLLIQYSRTKKPLDWLGKFVFRVVAESRLESFLWTMAQGYPIDVHKLEALLTSGELGGSFQSGTVLTEAAQNYLQGLFAEAGRQGGRPTVVGEIAELVRVMKRTRLSLDYWLNQNLWLELAERGDLELVLPDPETRRGLFDLGELLGIESKRFLSPAL
jgi:alpha-amylase/alpha-mannosidase (GH57 family)